MPVSDSRAQVGPDAAAHRSVPPGFTLVEVMVVIVTIGILAAIAIPALLSQRTRAIEAGEKSDARNLAVQLEAHYADGQRYPASGDMSWSAASRTVEVGTGGQAESVRLSPHNIARVVGRDGGRALCVEVRNTVTATTAVYEAGNGGLKAVGADAACPAEYDATVLAYPID